MLLYHENFFYNKCTKTGNLFCKKKSGKLFRLPDSSNVFFALLIGYSLRLFPVTATAIQ